MNRALRIGLGLLVTLLEPILAAAQARPFPTGDVQKTYERFLKQIEEIPMYDNHAHPGFADDTDVDAMAAPPNMSSTLRFREDNPEFIDAAKALFHYPYNDFQPEHEKWLAEKSKAAGRAMQRLRHPERAPGARGRSRRMVCDAPAN